MDNSQDWPVIKRPDTTMNPDKISELIGSNPTGIPFEPEWGYEFEEDGEIGILPVTFSTEEPSWLKIGRDTPPRFWSALDDKRADPKPQDIPPHD